jgi:two-component system cell cycle response regulator CtrA
LEIGSLDYDVVLLDLSARNTNGYDVLRRLRNADVRTPVLILLGLAELDHRIKGLGFHTSRSLPGSVAPAINVDADIKSP